MKGSDVSRQRYAAISPEDHKYQKKVDQEVGRLNHFPDQFQYHKLVFYENMGAADDGQVINFNVDEEISSYERQQVQRFYQVPSTILRNGPELKKYRHNRTPLAILPQKGSEESCLRLIVISDTHDRHFLLEDLPPCDILIHCGDILMKGRRASEQYALQKYQEFNEWIGRQPARHKLVIAGNHDYHLELWPAEFVRSSVLTHARYVCNEGLEVEGLRIFASPLSSGTSNNRAFQSDDFLYATVAKYREECDRLGGIDLLVTHSVSEDLLDVTCPQMMYIFGHVHEYYGLRLWPTSRKRDRSTPEASRESVSIMKDTWLGLSEYCGPTSDLQGVPLLVVSGCLLDAGYRMTNLPIVMDCHLEKVSAPL